MSGAAKPSEWPSDLRTGWQLLNSCERPETLLNKPQTVNTWNLTTSPNTAQTFPTQPEQRTLPPLRVSSAGTSSTGDGIVGVQTGQPTMQPKQQGKVQWKPRPARFRTRQPRRFGMSPAGRKHPSSV